jgi:hypothetical protein
MKPRCIAFCLVLALSPISVLNAQITCDFYEKFTCTYLEGNSVPCLFTNCVGDEPECPENTYNMQIDDSRTVGALRPAFTDEEGNTSYATTPHVCIDKTPCNLCDPIPGTSIYACATNLTTVPWHTYINYTPNGEPCLGQ